MLSLARCSLCANMSMRDDGHFRGRGEEGKDSGTGEEGRRGTKERDGAMKELKLLSAGMREIVEIAEGAGRAEQARYKGTWRGCRSDQRVASIAVSRQGMCESTSQPVRPTLLFSRCRLAARRIVPGMRAATSFTHSLNWR